MNKVEEPFLVLRTCTHKLVHAEEQESRPLENYRDRPAYVLLGDPGAGKTTSFKREAEESDGKYIRAREFVTLELGAECKGRTLFVDGLDEMRTDGGDGRTPLDYIRKQLQKLGHPQFRLSCREADWLGASDSEALKQVSSNGEIIALHLDPLDNADIAGILQHKSSVSNPTVFMHQAQEHGLDELLHNPQTLNLLVKAVGGKAWPKSRSDTYAMACTKLAGEENLEHRQAKRETASPSDSLLNAAGYLCAIQLLSGIAGYALDEESADAQHCCWKNLKEHSLSLLPALKTNLFQSDGEELRIPIHRSVAEFLGAQYLTARIRDGLPFGRVLALMTGEDGGIVSDLRGLGAWLSVHCHSGRHALIERDPVGVVLYGDVRNFPVQDKRVVIEAWKREAQRYPWFVSERWSSSSANVALGALCTTDMETTIREILTSSSREEADQALLDSVLGSICYGERMPSLADALEIIVRDSSYWPVVRHSAIAALLHAVSDDPSKLLKLAQDIRAGLVEDSDDELLGMLLSKLYPSTITASEIFSYLCPQMNDLCDGGYLMFWRYGLQKATEKDDLPLLLDKLAEIQLALRDILKKNYRVIQLMTGKLLVRGLEGHGDGITDERLYRWLGVGLDKYELPRLEQEYIERISAWFADRPERYRAVIEQGASLCANHKDPWVCMGRCVKRLYGSTPPVDIEMWYLEKAAAEQHAELSRFYFEQSVQWLRQQGRQDELTFPALEFLETRTNTYPKFQAWLEPFIVCPLVYSQKQAIGDRERHTDYQKRKNEWINHYRQHITAIRNGSAAPKILHDLAQAHDNLLLDAPGETPRERLENFLDGDNELIEAAYAGFRRALDRADLPSVSEIIGHEIKGEIHYIRSACLIGMEELFQESPEEALQLAENVLLQLLVFRLTYSFGNDPSWFSMLVRIRPALVADAILAYALLMLRAKKEHIFGVLQLVSDDSYAEVARLTLPKLLESFPLRAKANQSIIVLESLLRGALDYMDRELLAVLVARKLKLGSIDMAQRVYWLSCGLLLAPNIYEVPLFQYVSKSEVRRGYLVNFISSYFGRRSFPDRISIPVSAQARLIELLGPSCSNQKRPSGVVTAAMPMAKIVHSCINTLSGNPDEAATRELERLISLSDLLDWRNELHGALRNQRITRRKATCCHMSFEDVDRTLANLQPANAADLAALTFDHLCDIASKIRDGSTNDYKQYWSYNEGNQTLSKSKPENDCRDALLSDLQERLGKLNVEAQREGNYADDKRADIKVSFCGVKCFNVPIEIKKDSHDDLWRAIHEQLIPKYVRDPGTNGYGIYLVFWFGGQGIRPSPDGGNKPRSAWELEERLRHTLAEEESHHILVCVIDCALH